jgi:hypothetical protein
MPPLWECDPSYSWTGKSTSTGGWEKFDVMQIGQIKLETGKYTVRIKCSGELRGALMNLRSISFKAAKLAGIGT